jgi:CHAD domain-containing protein
MKAAGKPAGELLAAAVSKNWTRYRVQLRKCQKKLRTSAVHDLRTSIRRLMAALQLSEDVLGARRPQLEKIRKALKSEIHSLSELRDFQVQIRDLKKLEKKGHRKPILKFLKKKSQNETRKASSRLRGRHKTIEKGLLCLHYDLLEKCSKKADESTIDQEIENTLFRHLSNLHEHLKAATKKARAQNPSTVHRVRIEFKKFRYGREIMAPIILPSLKEPRGLNERLSYFQSVLGEIQDHDAMIETLELFLAKKGRHSGNRAIEEARRLIAWHGLEQNRLVEKLLKEVASSLEDFKPVRKLHLA